MDLESHWNFSELKTNLPPYNVGIREEMDVTEYVSARYFAEILIPREKNMIAGLAFVHQQDEESGYLLRCLFTTPGVDTVYHKTKEFDCQTAAYDFSDSVGKCEFSETTYDPVWTHYVFSLRTKAADNLVQTVTLETKNMRTHIDTLITWPAPSGESEERSAKIGALNVIVSFFAWEKDPKIPWVTIREILTAGGLYQYHQSRNTLLQGSQPKLKQTLDTPHSQNEPRKPISGLFSNEEPQQKGINSHEGSINTLKNMNQPPEVCTPCKQIEQENQLPQPEGSRTMEKLGQELEQQTTVLPEPATASSLQEATTRKGTETSASAEGGFISKQGFLITVIAIAALALMVRYVYRGQPKPT